jgi:NADH:ubiquinone oxidoreductase subunit F (NADH-binding)/Pyruvate/2-oxoacid:ferredoxin oxidoreductase delta subunit
MKANDHMFTRDFLLKRVLMNPQGRYHPEVQKQLTYIGRQRLNKPVIYVGMASCGIIAGAKQTFNAIKTYLKENGQHQVMLVEGGCKGFCSAEPLVDIQLPGKARISFSGVTHDKIQPLLDEVLNNNLSDIPVLGQYQSDIHQMWPNVPFIEDHEFFAHQKRILLDLCGVIDPISAEEYIAMGGYWAFADAISKHTPSQVCDIVETSQLAGRGGGGFLAGKKWKMTLNAFSDQKYFICNAVESDPGSYMNRTIIESNPHRLIEAILIASYAIGANKAYIFIRKEFNHAISRLSQAIENARSMGLIGHNILDSGVNIDLVIKQGARAFVCGEETALINSIEGKRAMPSSKPPFPAIRGLWDKPTIVNNVETLFNVPLIMRFGPKWFQEKGTINSKGTKLFSLSGKVKNQGTIEVPMGMTFREIIDKIAGGLSNSSKFKAIVLGINSGSYIIEENLDIRVDFNDLKNIGASLGSGAFVVVDQSTCMVDLAKFFTGFFKNESCGKCIPCREGTARMLEIMQMVSQRPSNANSFQTLERFKGVMQLRGLAEVIKDTSLCSLGKSSPNAILNTLKYFKSEFDAHIFERKCPANVCRDLRIFSIDVDLCTGCTACLKKCPVDAIIGSPRSPHFIIEDRCLGCGTCYDVCKFNAVMVK